MLTAPLTRTPDEVLDMVLRRCECVTPCGAGRARFRCPVHDDRHPSATASQGHRGILVKCWVGCSTEAIVKALGLTLSDLFYDAPRTPRQRAVLPPLARPFDWRLVSAEQLHRRDALDLRADRTMAAATGVDISPLPDEDTHKMLNAVADAYADRDLADRLEQAAFQIRWEGVHAERERYARRGTSHS